MQLLTVKEGCELLRVKPTRAYELIRQGHFPPGVVVEIGRRQLRFSEDGLRNWIEAGGNIDRREPSEVGHVG
jgi:excisionase family DNA binding protein